MRSCTASACRGHQLFLDGVYELDQDKKPIRFHITKAPTHEELNNILTKIIHRTIKLLEKRGLILKDEEDHLRLNINDDEDSLSSLQAGSVTYRFTLGPNKGKKALTLKTLSESNANRSLGLVAKNAGFSAAACVAVQLRMPRPPRRRCYEWHRAK
jgi:hypothetical protein